MQQSGVARGCLARGATAFNPPLRVLRAEVGERGMLPCADDGAVGCAKVAVLPCISRALTAGENATVLGDRPTKIGSPDRRPQDMEGRAQAYQRVVGGQRASLRACRGRAVLQDCGLPPRCPGAGRSMDAAVGDINSKGMMLKMACHFFGTAALNVLGFVAQLDGPPYGLRRAE